MKKLKINLFFVFILLIFVSFAYAENISNGFMGIKWGESIAALQGFSKLDTKDDVEFYRNPRKVYRINNYLINQAVYGFYAGKFFAVYIQVKDVEAFSEIKKYMKSTYGDPKRSLSMKSDQIVDQWKSENVKIKLKQDKKTGAMKLAFYYMPLSTKINEDRQEEYNPHALRFLPIKRDKRPAAMPLLTF
ncbi:hypothetical protein ACFLZM_03570 [Thermodesulfobacteriota bacterium]